MTHAPTHMNNPKITRAPLPALLPTILAGLFILAGCGGSALPIPVIATESADVANKTESNTPDSIFLNVGEEPPVDTVKSSAKSAPPPAETPIVQAQKQKQEPKPKPAPKPKPKPKPEPKQVEEEEQTQEQVPPPVFEVAVAPALPPQRSFSQSQPEPKTETDSVPRSDATGQSNHEDGKITFADWVASFGEGNAPPTKAETTTITITSTLKNLFREVRSIEYGTIYADGATEPIYAESDLAQFVPTYAVDDTEQMHPIYALDDLAQLNPTNAIGQKILANAVTAFKDANGFLIYEEAGNNILEDGTSIPYVAGARVVTTVAVPLMENGNLVLDSGGINPIMVARKVKLTDKQNDYIEQHGRLTFANKQTGLTDLNPQTRTKVAGVKNEFLQGGAGGRLDETVCDLCISYSTNSKGKLLNGKGKLLNGDGVFRAGGEARIIISGQVSNRGSLNLATATFGGQKLGGDAADGVAFFRGFDDVPAPNDKENGYEHSNAGLAHNYAGLYSSTDLGAPVSGTSTALWNGRIRTLGWFDFDMDFTLRVTFGNDNTGTLNVAELRNSKNRKQFLQIINATYNAEGVISGTILIDEDDDDFGIGPQYGFLSGLIGADGAVVAFLSSGENDGETGTTGEKEDITDGSHRFGYTGGFVARPGVVANPDVTIEDWTGSFANVLPSGVKKHSISGENPLNQFLLRDDPAKRASWKTTEGGSLSLSALGGDATDGVDFFPADINRYGRGNIIITRTYHAGLWDSTDLGAEISLGEVFNGDMTAMWKGKFSVFQGANARFDDDDFTFMVDFINNSFSATVAAGAKNYYLSGNYNARGLMTGRVSYLAAANADTDTNGIISGLIGAEGAVGAFVSNAEATSKATAIRNGDADVVPSKNAIDGGTGATGYAGGFVASPISPPPVVDVVDVSDINYTFTRNFLHIEYRRKTAEEIQMEMEEEIQMEEEDEEQDKLQKVIRTETEVVSNINYADIPTTVAGLADTPNPDSRFLRIEGLIDSRGLSTATIHTRRRDYTAGSAGFGDGYAIISSHGYVGILPTTDLGAARPVGAGEQTDARWNGSYSLSGNGAFAPNIPIWFDINFDAGTLTGTAPLANSLTDDITINTTFGADGVMRGTFSTDKVFLDGENEVYTIPEENTTVIGLIGTEGLVGIMHGNVILNTTVTGGFVASP